MRMRSMAALLAMTLVAAACGAGTVSAPSSGDASGTVEAAVTTLGDGHAAMSAGDCTPGHLDVVAAGNLTIVTGATPDPPWVIDDDPGSGDGFDSAVAYAVAAELGFEPADVQWVRSDLSAGVPPEGPYDFGIHHLSRTRALDDEFDLSVPYAYVPRVLVAEPGSAAAGATTLLDLLSVWLSTTMDSSEHEYIREVVGSDAAYTYDTVAETFAAVSSGEVDATVASLPVARHLIESSHPDLAIVASFPTDEDDADALVLALPVGSALVPCVDAVVERLRGDGTIDALTETWLQPAPVVEIITKPLRTEYVTGEPDSVDYAYLIPDGTADRIDAGEVIEIMPNELEVVVGEVIEIVNEDEQGYIVGPFYVGPRETMRQKFLSAGEFTGRCAVSPSGDIVLRVSEA